MTSGYSNGANAKADKCRMLLVTRPGIGGAAKYVLMLADMLDKSRFDVSIIASTLEDPEYPKRLKDTGATVYIVDMTRELSPIRDVVAFFKILRIIRQGKYDAVYTHATKPGLLGRLAAAFCRTKAIYHSPHVFYFDYPISKISKFLNIQMEQFLARFTTKILLESKVEAQSVLDREIFAKDKVLSIPNAIRLDEYDIRIEPSKEKALLGIDEKLPVVGSVCRLTIQKDPFTFVRSARRVVDTMGPVQFLMIGDGYLYGKVQALIKSLGLTAYMRLLGHRRDFVNIISIFDVSVLSTVCEGLPFVLLESMALKKPVVATRVPGCSDVVIDGKTGFLVEPKSPQAMADKIVLLLKDKSLAQRLGEAGRRHVEDNFEASRWIKEMEALYTGQTA
jgi:glycosyltransferase involved in cell wall biosynthesis